MGGVMSPATFVLYVLACTISPPPRDCVVVIAEVPTVQDCRVAYDELKASLPPGMALGFPECHRIRKEKSL